MKKEEKLLNALGDVKSSYILECSQYMGNEQKEVLLLKPGKNRWAHFAAIAAVMALFITATLALAPRARREAQSEETVIRSDAISLGDGTQLRLSMETEAETNGFSPIRQIEVYRGDALLQTIRQDALPDRAENYNEGIFVSTGQSGRMDIRDLNFDGYTDIGFPALGEESENLPYHYFLWNPESGKYDYGFLLFGGDALTVDSEQKLLIETAVVTPAPVLRYYRYENGALLQVDVEAEVSTLPEFQLSYDETEFALTSGESGTFLSRLQGVGSYTPVCEIQIEFLPGVLPSAAADASQRALEGAAVSPIQRTRDWDRILLNVLYGEQWDSKVEDIHFIGAGASGTFRLTSRYFLEASEGYGMTFAKICTSFACPLSSSANPEAERAAMSFADGFFSGSWTDMEPYLNDPNGEISHEDVYSGGAEAIELVELRGLEQLDAAIAENGTGSLSLVFRESGEDSYTFLSMDMTKADDGYKISFFGLEK